jgi:hypothetical protein
LISYFFLKPAGHFGFTAVTFLLVFPLTQVIVAVFTAGLAEALGVGVGEGDGVATTSTSWLSFTRTVGAENPKLYAANSTQPFRSPKTVVATDA